MTPPSHVRDHAMSGDSPAQGWTHVNDLQVAHVSICRDSLLDDRSERLAQRDAQQCKNNRERQTQDPPKGGSSSSHREPGKRPGQKRSGCQIGPAPGVDGESAFAGAQTRQCLRHRRLNVVGWKIPEDEKAGRVGMSGHLTLRIFIGEDVQGGMFKRVVAPRFEYEGKVQYRISHAAIIPSSLIGIFHGAKRLEQVQQDRIGEGIDLAQDFAPCLPRRNVGFLIRLNDGLKQNIAEK